MVIADMRREQRTMREIARELGRSPATVSRELRRNADDHGRYLPRSADGPRPNGSRGRVRGA